MVHKSNARNQIKFTNKRGDAKNVPFSSSYNVTESDTTKKSILLMYEMYFYDSTI